jgi:hypothetical protein
LNNTSILFTTKHPVDGKTILGDIEKTKKKYQTFFAIFLSIAFVFHPPRVITRLFQLPQLSFNIELTIRSPPLDHCTLLFKLEGHF